MGEHLNVKNLGKSKGKSRPKSSKGKRKKK